MRIGKSLAIVVVSLASLIVIGAALVAVSVLIRARSGDRQNFVPPNGQQTVSPSGDDILISQASGSSSFLYRRNPLTGLKRRLTSSTSGIESEPSFSHDGKLIAYSFASFGDSRSSVWIVGADGLNPHQLTGNDQDALHPVFSPDDTLVFYAVSASTGNHSPIVRPARHDWDVFSIPAESAKRGDTLPTQITRRSLYDLKSLDAAKDEVQPGGIKLLISTYGYPIGALIEELNLGDPSRDKIFQPHVPGDAGGAEFGEARFIHGDMSILFLAASTPPSGGYYDYNVYTMSAVTGGEIKQLTHVKGITTDLRVLPSGSATFRNSGDAFLLQPDSGTLRPLQ